MSGVLKSWMLITTHDTSVDSPAYMQRVEPEIWYISWHMLTMDGVRIGLSSVSWSKEREWLRLLGFDE